MDEQAQEGESENAKKDPGGKKGGDHRHGRESKKGGKAERQKGGREVGGEPRGKTKDSQVSWVQKKAEAEYSEEDKHDRRGRDKARERREGNWEGQGRRAESKKESWKERRGKQQERYDGESGANTGIGKQRAGEGNTDQVLNGGALLSLLKANPPSVTRYSREELLSIGQLPASKVKPASLDTIIDKENLSSPLLVRPKVDKAARPPRQGEEDAYHEEANGTQRHRQRGDDEEDGERRRGRNRWGEEREQGRGQRWQEDHYEDNGAHQHHYQQQQQHHHQQHHHQQDEWQMPSAPSRGGADEWDMPDMNDTGDLMDFTLGDIRKAEKSFNKGMSLSDYKASLRAGNLEVANPEATVGSKERKDRDGNLPGATFFVEEDEDVSQASRGFGKWFGRTPADNDQEWEDDGDDKWDMPTTAPSGGLAAFPPSMASSKGLGSALNTVDTSKPSPAQQLQHHSPAELQLPRSPQAHPLASSIDRLLEESPSSKREADSHADDGSSNLLGKSILSMLGRTEPAIGEASIAEDPAKQGKLSVAELFHLAQGKELPPIPPVSSKTKEEVGSEETDQQKMQREVFKMAQAQMAAMWMNAAKAGQPQMPPGSRYPGYQQTAPYGAVPPTAFGMSRSGGSNAMGSRAVAQDLYAQQQAEAYAQMMSTGRGGFPTNSTSRGTKGAQASWTSPMGTGYPYPRGQNYGTQSQYGAYSPQDYSHLSSGIGGYDGGNAQAYNAQATALHNMYSGGGLGATAEGQATIAARSVAKSPEKGNNRNSYLNQASTLSPPPVGATSGTGGPVSQKLAGQDGNEEESGCSQS